MTKIVKRKLFFLINSQKKVVKRAARVHKYVIYGYNYVPTNFLHFAIIAY